MEDRFAGMKLILSIIQTMGVLVAAASLVLSLWGIREQHEWNRRQQALTILEKFNSEVAPHRTAIFAAYPGINDENTNQIPTHEECQTIIKARKPGETKIRGIDAFELRSHLVSVLNYFEDLAIAWEYQVGDQTILEEAAAPVILRWYQVFQPCITEMDKEAGESVWPSLERVVASWEEKRAKPAHKIPQTGYLRLSAAPDGRIRSESEAWASLDGAHLGSDRLVPGNRCLGRAG
ncbi:MAG TPA: hypothetical protein VFE33_32375 [Thermoanaerobaculia bacterium]|nr:hypothetical protein [Thermoanaerobaculia bacterium]